MLLPSLPHARGSDGCDLSDTPSLLRKRWWRYFPKCMDSVVDRPHLHVYASMHAFLCQASSARVCVYACFPLSSHGVQAFDRAARRIKSSAACVGVICLHHQLHFQLKRQHCGVHDCGAHRAVHDCGVHDCGVHCAVHGSTVVCMRVQGGISNVSCERNKLHLCEGVEQQREAMRCVCVSMCKCVCACVCVCVCERA